MKKANAQDDFRQEYQKKDLGEGVRGKHYNPNVSTCHIAILTPEVAKAFPSDEAVNKALLSLIKADPHKSQ